MGAELPLLHPRPLAAGTTIGVCAPAGPVNGEVLAAGIAWLESMGYRVRCGAHLALRRGYLAGTDAQRLSDLLELVRAPDVDGIVLARGGYGIARLLREIDPLELRVARKLIVGYSDATSLLLFLCHRAGLAAVHGPMLERAVTPKAQARWLAVVRGDAGDRTSLCGRSLRGGCVQGPLVGGNLTMIAASLGTPWEIDTRGAILFFEEVAEEPYAIDRLLVQLREAGKLHDAIGVGVGQLVSCVSERYPEPSAAQVLEANLSQEVRGPIVTELPFGHVLDHQALAVGVQGELDAEHGTLRLLESVVGEDS